MTQTFVATLVAASPFALDLSHIDCVREELDQAGATAISYQWLAVDKAADVFFTGRGDSSFWPCPQSLSPPPNLHRKGEGITVHLLQALASYPIDFIIQPTANRRKKLLVADMESTIIQEEMLDEMAGRLGLREQVSTITQRAMNGELDFKTALHERIKLFAGQPASMLDMMAERMTITAGAAELITAMKKAGAQCWLVSGGFTCFADRVGQRLGFDRVYANTLVIENGSLTGEVMEPILDKDSKRSILETGCAELDITLADCLSVGDGANDIPMLNACNDAGGVGVAFHAKPNVRAVVVPQINHGDLSLLTYAQAIPFSLER